MSDMNGQQSAAAPLDPDAQAVVTCLEQLLAEARRGGIVCIGVAKGAMRQIAQQQAQAAQQSRILRPAANFDPRKMG